LPTDRWLRQAEGFCPVETQLGGNVAATDAVLPDLAAEGDELDQLVSGIEPDRWQTVTPSPGWTIAHQIGHLAASDRFTALAVTDPEAFAASLSGLAGDLSEVNDAVAADAAVLPPEDLLTEWRAARAEAIAALSSVPVADRVQWIVTPMSPASLASTRLMELVGHGQDIRDALGVTWVPTDRILHVARIGARTRNFAYRIRGLEPPPQDFRIELVAPSGELWTFGPPNAPQRVAGPAADFCLLVTRRRHRADLALSADGDDADEWLDFAQAYAGPPSRGRAPGQFRAAGG
jgi:uncharacterized protein (TIGR03084 family)